MLSVEPTPLREESIELWGADARLDVDGAHKNAVLFGDTKVLQSSPGEPAYMPDGDCLAITFGLANVLHGRRHPCHNVFFYFLFCIFYNYIFICFRRYGVPVHRPRRPP